MAKIINFKTGTEKMKIDSKKFIQNQKYIEKIFMVSGVAGCAIMSTALLLASFGFIGVEVYTCLISLVVLPFLLIIGSVYYGIVMRWMLKHPEKFEFM